MGSGAAGTGTEPIGPLDVDGPADLVLRNDLERRRRRTIWFVILLLMLGSGFVAYWWNALHGQAWLSYQTGSANTAPRGLSVPHGYNFYSGFGSILLPVVIQLAGFTAIWRWHHRCHEPLCVRYGKVTVDDHGTLSCYVHHPEGRPRKGHILRKHAEHQKVMAAIRKELAERQVTRKGR